MTIEIIELTDDQIQETKAKFPQSKPKRFRVKEGKSTLAYCDTRKEAEREVKQWNARDNLTDDIGDFLYEMIDKYDNLLDEDEVREILKSYQS